MVVEKKKYIIELPENTHWIQWAMEGTKDHHPYMDYKQVEDLTPYTEDSAYAHGYTEAESKYREIRDKLEKQAYQRGYETAKHECEANIQSNRDEAYNKGHNDGFKFGYEKLKDLEHERVEKAYQRGYKEAYDTAYADAEEIYESGKRVMYQKGLKDAWECARKINAMDSCTRDEIFGLVITSNITDTFSASEAIEKIRQYEQRQEEQIRVGDEVEDGVANLIVLEINQDGTVSGFDDEGSIIHATPRKKTGRHFPEIAEVLQKMKENNDNK